LTRQAAPVKQLSNSRQLEPEASQFQMLALAKFSLLVVAVLVVRLMLAVVVLVGIFIQHRLFFPQEQ
jgi:hypothetical protein